ncbi:MAG: diacylglycerol kinase family protein, partial [Anaerolineae bacterium]|nr:diacylglycerol kinase family protein [Anaerolineae bacterium]
MPGNINEPVVEAPADSQRHTVWGAALDIVHDLYIDPDDYSPITSTSRWASFRYALAGWLYMLRHQKNTRIQAAATLLVLAFGLWLEITPGEWAVIVIAVTIVWITEFINAAIEAAVNLASPDLHPMAKVGKDVAAAAVLLGAVSSLLVGLLIFGP